MGEADRRGTERVMLEIPIRVMSFASGGRGFTEDTRTIQVNQAGARIALRHRVTTADEIRIINLANLREADFRVVGPVRLEGGQVSEWGVECLEKGRNVWGIDFPAPLDPTSAQAGALLQCQGCKSEVLQVLTLVEVDVLESTGWIQRLCEPCGQFSSWVCADVIRCPQTPSPETVASLPSSSVEPWDRKTERRAHKRVAVKLPVLARNHAGEQEVSKSENISKGGLAVCLHLKLTVGDIVTMACPYTQGDQNLLQKAEVRRRVSVTADRKWLYGLRYIL
jgi:hypothetical protein